MEENNDIYSVVKTTSGREKLIQLRMNPTIKKFNTLFKEDGFEILSIGRLYGLKYKGNPLYRIEKVKEFFNSLSGF